MVNRMNRGGRRAFIGVFAGGCLVAPRLLAAEAAGKVETSRGDCYAQNRAVRRTLAPDASVFIGDAVGTGPRSALAMRLGTATQVKLGADARLHIDRFLVNAGGVLVLDAGAMLYDHDAQASPQDLSVRSPFGLIAVRDTRYFAGPSNGVFGVFVERGHAMVVGVNTAVIVSDGLGTDIARPGAEPTAPRPWGAARIASAMASVTP